MYRSFFNSGILKVILWQTFRNYIFCGRRSEIIFFVADVLKLYFFVPWDVSLGGSVCETVTVCSNDAHLCTAVYSRTYESGMCGGPGSRQCCAPPGENLGESNSPGFYTMSVFGSSCNFCFFVLFLLPCFLQP